MKKVLPKTFEITKYGVTARLVEEKDAAFITELRSDKRLGRYIHASDGDVEKQVQWIREYKKREAEGLDYYFIFSKDGENYGLSRIYNIDWTHLTYTSGSWVCKQGTPMLESMLTGIIVGEFALRDLGLLVDIYDVRKGNKQVLRYHRKILCAIEYGETEDDVLFMTTPESRKKSKLRKYLGL